MGEIRKFRVSVVQEAEVEVTLDASKFTPEFQAEFASFITPMPTIEEHAEHLAWIYARDEHLGFVEGYGEVRDMGIRARLLSPPHVETEIVATDEPRP